MGPNPQFPADLVTFTEEIHNGKLHILCSVCTAVDKYYSWYVKNAIKYIFFDFFIVCLIPPGTTWNRLKLLRNLAEFIWNQPKPPKTI